MPFPRVRHRAVGGPCVGPPPSPRRQAPSPEGWGCLFCNSRGLWPQLPPGSTGEKDTTVLSSLFSWAPSGREAQAVVPPSPSVTGTLSLPCPTAQQPLLSAAALFACPGSSSFPRAPRDLTPWSRSSPGLVQVCSMEGACGVLCLEGSQGRVSVGGHTCLTHRCRQRRGDSWRDGGWAVGGKCHLC